MTVLPCRKGEHPFQYPFDILVHDRGVLCEREAEYGVCDVVAEAASVELFEFSQCVRDFALEQPHNPGSRLPDAPGPVCEPKRSYYRHYVAFPCPR